MSTAAAADWSKVSPPFDVTQALTAAVIALVAATVRSL